ncbi:hypothetical protein [Sphingobium sp. MK2]|uniref:hypothetical protein n=1 Tax=Sphingobium sp. MK2 TaxID=3116540 RepID=UPI0032E3663A
MLYPDHNLLQAYAQAQAALERIEERRRLSPVRQPWRTRCLIAERQTMAQMDGRALDDLDVQINARGRVSPSAFDLSFARDSIGASISLDALMRDAPALLTWLGKGHGRSLHDRTVGDIYLAIERWQQDVRALPPSPPLLQSAEVARLWRHHAPLGRDDLVASLLIGDRWGPGRWDGSAGGLTAMGLERSHAPWRVAQDDQLPLLWLKAIARGAQAQLDLEMRLRGYAKRAMQHVAQRRRPGKLQAVLLLAMGRPRITSRQVADALDLTSAGAIKLLTIATESGLLIEQSGQASYRSYAIPVSLSTTPLPSSPRHSEWLEDEFSFSGAEIEGSPEAS